MLRVRFRARPRSLSNAMGVRPDGHGTGPEGRIIKLRQLVTELVRHERIEGRYEYLDESRPYVELLVQRAIRNGDKCQETMDLADYWLLEKDLIPKLFKVLVPRYQNYRTSITAMYNLPIPRPNVIPNRQGCLELKENPWPPIRFDVRRRGGSLVNVLLAEAQKEYSRSRHSKPAPAATRQTDAPLQAVCDSEADREEGTPV